jgi:hypothetical protein
MSIHLAKHVFFAPLLKSDLIDLLRGKVEGEVIGEELSISLVYALGLWTDQTSPIRASKRNTAGKEQNQVGSREGKLGRMGA